MNRYVRRIFSAYSMALLAAFIYVPWCGQSWEPGVAPVVVYGFFWGPPPVPGYVVSLDAGRLLLEVLSLTVVLAVGTVTVWGKEDCC
jgi:hypothetical protein